MQSLEHVNDSFLATYPWPSSAGDLWPVVMLFHYLFVAGILFPALLLVYGVWRDRGWAGLLGSRELLLFSPLIGLTAALMLSTGEARYRVPSDTALVVLACEFYRRAWIRGRRDYFAEEERR